MDLFFSVCLYQSIQNEVTIYTLQGFSMLQKLLQMPLCGPKPLLPVTVYQLSLKTCVPFLRTFLSAAGLRVECVRFACKMRRAPVVWKPWLRTTLSSGRSFSKIHLLLVERLLLGYVLRVPTVCTIAEESWPILAKNTHWLVLPSQTRQFSCLICNMWGVPWSSDSNWAAFPIDGWSKLASILLQRVSMPNQ